MKVDSHQHFWKYNPDEYGWISNEMKILQKDHLPMHLKTQLQTVGFDGSVAVQARQSLEETKWLLGLADENDFIKGVVGWVDLRSDQAEEQLAELSVHPKLAGIRHVIHDEPDVDFMLRPDFLRGISLLQKFNLTYDILIFPNHLQNSLKLVDYFPNQVFILDHIAKPFIKDKITSPWNDEIKLLAGYPNVYCKLSGMVTEADWKHWKPEDFRIYLQVVYEAFGPHRLMIGSDWPVCTVAGSYRHVMDIVMDFTGNLSASDQDKILGGNAMNVYNLK
jgi:L-fuconolactonase